MDWIFSHIDDLDAEAAMDISEGRSAAESISESVPAGPKVRDGPGSEFDTLALVVATRLNFLRRFWTTLQMSHPLTHPRGDQALALREASTAVEDMLFLCCCETALSFDFCVVCCQELQRRSSKALGKSIQDMVFQQHGNMSTFRDRAPPDYSLLGDALWGNTAAFYAQFVLAFWKHLARSLWET